MATITRRKAGQWRARVRRVGYPVQSKTFASRAEAEAWARLIESEMDRGIWQSREEAEKTTLGELVARYAAEVAIRHKGSRQEVNRLKTFLADDLSHRRLATLRSADFAAWRDRRLKQVGAGTCLRELALLRAIFNVARRDWGIAMENPLRWIRMPPEPPHRDRRMTLEEEAAILDGADRKLAEALIVAVETGLRASELCAARREHLDIKRRVLRIPDSKSGKPRDVPLSRRAAEVLRNRPARIDGRLLDYSNPQYLSQCFKDRCRSLGIADLRLHDLRHTCLSRLAEKGWSAAELMALSGHRQLGMLGRYLHVTMDHLVGKLDAG